MNNITNVVLATGAISLFFWLAEILFLVLSVKCAKREDVKYGVLFLSFSNIAGKLAQYMFYATISVGIVKLAIYYR